MAPFGAPKEVVMAKLWWTRQDRQGDIDMGEYPTKEDAYAAIDSAKALLLDQCSTDEQRDEIVAGSWSVEA